MDDLPAQTPGEPPDHGGATASPEDHRVRVGRERRERMREHLLASVLHVCSTETARSPAVIDNVVQHARVSRGTFYKYFDSLDQAIAAVANRLGDEMTASIVAFYAEITDPVSLVATGFQCFLIRALLDPAWGGFILKMDLLSKEDDLLGQMGRDITLGVQTGDFSVPTVRIAQDALMGVKNEAIRHIIGAPTDLTYIQATASMVLRSFGVPAFKADRAVHDAVVRLRAEAPGRLFWWTDLPQELRAA